ncbi:MAG: diacylglycerol kinase family lipid kinase [Treponema sp.]|nr:diacylglycerol kinase family lipid kinase [Treponema sp.]
MAVSDKNKQWIILNPVAGKGKALKAFPKIEKFLKKHSRNFEIVFTRGPGDALELVQNLPIAEEDMTVAAGGDGTCNEVVNGLLTHKPPLNKPPLLGLLPVGRGNDFSSTPGIPEDPEKALEILIQRKTRPLDAGFLKGGFFPEGRYFVNGVGIGFDTKVGFEAAKMKRIQSGFAYALGAFLTVMRYEASPELRIRYGGREETLPTAIVSIMNGRRMGGSFFMGPNALLDDGELDICFIRRPPTRLKLINVVLHYTKGTQAECEGTYTGRASAFHLKALKGGMAVHCDGETVCYDGKELEINCVPGALRLAGV